MCVSQQNSGPMSSPGDRGIWSPGLALRMLTSTDGLKTSVLFWLWICSARTLLSLTFCTVERHLSFIFPHVGAGARVSESSLASAEFPSLSTTLRQHSINVYWLNEWLHELMCKLHQLGFVCSTTYIDLHLWHCHSALLKFGLESREKI